MVRAFERDNSFLQFESPLDLYSSFSELQSSIPFSSLLIVYEMLK